MLRTLVTIAEEDKRWLDRYSEQHRWSTAQTIRLAIKEFQKKTREGNYGKVLKSTAGLFKGTGDAVEFVRKIRREWD